jgi:putative addiction module killer protein
MVTILKTKQFSDWFSGLKDLKGKARIQARIDRVELGNYGDCESVGYGVLELRIHYGPGYRVYLMKKGSQIVILLAGGDKGSQKADIRTALLLSKHV